MSAKSIAKKAFKANAITEEEYKQLLCVIKLSDESLRQKCVWINAPTVEITEEQAIDKLHETGWLPLHDKEMTERPTGHWLKVTDCYCWHWECENCHSRPSRTSTGHDDLSNFCPNCGAEMRKEENDVSE